MEVGRWGWGWGWVGRGQGQGMGRRSGLHATAGRVSRGGFGHHHRGWVWTRMAIWPVRMCLGSSGGVCLSSLSSGVYFPECGSADWSSICENSPFGVSCSVELSHNWAWRVFVRSACEKLERVCKECNWSKGKIKSEMVLLAKWVILWTTRKLISVWPNFLCLPNIRRVYLHSFLPFYFIYSHILFYFQN